MKKLLIISGLAVLAVGSASIATAASSDTSPANKTVTINVDNEIPSSDGVATAAIGMTTKYSGGEGYWGESFQEGVKSPSTKTYKMMSSDETLPNWSKTYASVYYEDKNSLLGTINCTGVDLSDAQAAIKTAKSNVTFNVKLSIEQNVPYYTPQCEITSVTPS